MVGLWQPGFLTVDFPSIHLAIAEAGTIEEGPTPALEYLQWWKKSAKDTPDFLYSEVS
jgi:hypothetical protein